MQSGSGEADGSEVACHVAGEPGIAESAIQEGDVVAPATLAAADATEAKFDVSGRETNNHVANEDNMAHEGDVDLFTPQGDTGASSEPAAPEAMESEADIRESGNRMAHADEADLIPPQGDTGASSELVAPEAPENVPEGREPDTDVAQADAAGLTTSQGDTGASSEPAAMEVMESEAQGREPRNPVPPVDAADLVIPQGCAVVSREPAAPGATEHEAELRESSSHVAHADAADLITSQGDTGASSEHAAPEATQSEANSAHERCEEPVASRVDGAAKFKHGMCDAAQSFVQADSEEAMTEGAEASAATIEQPGAIDSSSTERQLEEPEQASAESPAGAVAVEQPPGSESLPSAEQSTDADETSVEADTGATASGQPGAMDDSMDDSPRAAAQPEEAEASDAHVQGSYYDLLELPPTASTDEIRRAYKRLALIWHPDKAADGEETKSHFQAICEAYETLSDTNRRWCYDAILRACEPAQPDTRPTAAELFPEGFDQVQFRATVGELKAIAAFVIAGQSWDPEVKEINWSRMPRAPKRVRLTFTASYRLPGRRAGAALSYNSKEGRMAVHAAFQQNIDRLINPDSGVVASFYVITPKEEVAPELSVRVALEGDTMPLMEQLRHAQANRAPVSSDCVLA